MVTGRGAAWVKAKESRHFVAYSKIEVVEAISVIASSRLCCWSAGREATMRQVEVCFQKESIASKARQ